MDLGKLRQRILVEIETDPHLKAIRAHNHVVVGELAKDVRLRGSTMLDLGASIHGYALEAALEQGVGRYEGIDIDVERHWGQALVEVQGPPDGMGRLRQMRAEKLDFPDNEFDCILSMSTFEHFLEPSTVLSEMFRVLKPGGVALVSFEPVWSWAYGSHLQHFGPIFGVAPPWSHLILDEKRMRLVLERQKWPAGAPVSLNETLHWIYRSAHLNRRTIRELKAIFAASDFEIAWTLDQLDPVDDTLAMIASYISTLVPLTPEELLCRGLSLLLRRPDGPG